MPLIETAIAAFFVVMFLHKMFEKKALPVSYGSEF
jgi:hypothetical protein